MPENRISASLPADTKAEILAQLQSIREQLPFLTDLSTDEIRSLPKLGDKSRTFVSKALELAQQNPDFLPRSFDIDEMAKDVDLFMSLQPIRLALSQLLELVDDTTTLAGSEAYAAALVVYNYAKATGREQGLDAAVDELGRRFGRRSTPPRQRRKPKFYRPACDFRGMASNFSRAACNFRRLASIFLRRSSNFWRLAAKFWRTASNFSRPVSVFQRPLRKFWWRVSDFWRLTSKIGGLCFVV